MTDFLGEPTFEARVRALEDANVDMRARVSQVSIDVRTSGQQQAAYLIALEKRIDERFDTLRDELKTEIAESEGRILEAFKQLLVMMPKQGE